MTPTEWARVFDAMTEAAANTGGTPVTALAQVFAAAARTCEGINREHYPSDQHKYKSRRVNDWGMSVFPGHRVPISERWTVFYLSQ